VELGEVPALEVCPGDAAQVTPRSAAWRRDP
jgi:hypothetical protein